jgi:hypothetical protein
MAEVNDVKIQWIADIWMKVKGSETKAATTISSDDRQYLPVTA